MDFACCFEKIFVKHEVYSSGIEIYGTNKAKIYIKIFFLFKKT